MKKLLPFLLLFCTLAIQAQKSGLEKQIVSNLTEQILAFPQEKIYIQTDKPYYICGEKIFFRTFLLHASLNNPIRVSRYVYVELINPSNEPVLRQQIRVDDNDLFYGALLLPEDLPEGNYQIRSYTRFMENSGEEWFYSRPVFIAHPNASKVEIETRFEFFGEKQAGIALQFKDRKQGFAKQPESVQLTFGEVKSKEIKPDSEGWIAQKFNIKDSDTKRTLLIAYKDGNHSFSKYISIPYQNNQPGITFYPEGGNLIAGQRNRIAFKILLSDGNPGEIAGSVFNSQGGIQTSFSVIHDGMGDFYLDVQENETYYAQFNHEGKIIKIDLPAVSPETFSIQAHWQEEDLIVSVLNQKIPSSNYYLLIHHQGVPSLFEGWDFSENQKIINKNQFKTGVSHLLLLDENLQIVSERLIFNNQNNQPEVEIITNKTAFKPREQIEMDIRIPDLSVVTAAFSVSVTDDKDVKLDTTTNIISEILLSAELQGTIRNPVWYFRENAETQKAADLLMLTHGWRKYHVREALQNDIQLLKIRPETSYIFSGVLKTLKEKPADFGVIQLKTLGYDFTEAVEADEKGRYYFSGFEFPDSTAYQLFANDKKRKLDVEIYPDEITYPEISLLRNFETGLSEKEILSEEFVDYVGKADKKWVIENGMRMIYLSEVKIKTAKKKQKLIDNRTPFRGIDIPIRAISPEEMEEEPPVTFEILFSRIGVIVNKTDLLPLIVINGRSYGIHSINSLENEIRVEDIAQIEYHNSPALASVYGGADTIIIMTLWPPGYRGKDGNQANDLFQRIILPLGYQKPVEFYSPQYDTPQTVNDKNPDLRSTIYWKPDVVLNDENEAFVGFYSADDKTTYSVVIEGISKNREFIYKKQEAFVRVE